MKNVTYINAGAGSGKTYTLTELLSDVLSSGKARPDEVILTTFTVKAANDFKERSKARLFEKGLFEEANLLDGALIGTIHSVAYSIISKFWYYLGLPPQPQIMTEEDGNVYRAQSLGSLPTKEELNFLKEFAEMFEMKEGMDPTVNYDFWQPQLNAIIGFTTNYEIDDYALSRERSKAFYREFVSPAAPALPGEKEMKEVMEVLQTIFDGQKDSKANSERKKSLKELSYRVKRPTFGFYNELLKLGTSIKATKENPVVAALNEKLSTMWQTKEVYALVERYIDVMFDLATRWRNRYEAFKKERNILDFNDLEKYMLRLLRTPFAAKEIGRQYRYVFVDEFQDCSPIQIKIFSELSDLVEHSYWVGDMKQSIFGFRGSDTSLTDAVVKLIDEGLDGCGSRTLLYSWRSVPEIVNFCNDIFVRAFSPDIPAERVMLTPKKTSEAGVAPLVVWDIDDEESLVKHIVQLIEDGVEPSAIAILHRKGDPLNEIGAKLAAYNVPVNLSTQPIMSSKAALLAKAILSVADNDADSLAKGEVAFLLDPRYDTENLISETLGHVDPATGRPDHSFLDEIPVLRRLAAIRERLKQQSVAEFVESVILELNLFEEVKKCCSAREGASVLNAIIAAAKTYEEISLRVDAMPTIKGFIDYLYEGSITLPGDPDGVSLLTMHKSKGLEWEHVIVTSLSSHPADVKTIMKREVFGVHFRRTELPTRENLFPTVYITLLPFIYGSGNSKVPAPIDGIIGGKPEFAKICRDKIAEETRLLYVALSRPATQLILSLKGKNPLKWFEDMGLVDVSDKAALVNDFGFKAEGLNRAIEPHDPETVEQKTYPVAEDKPNADRRDCFGGMMKGGAVTEEAGRLSDLDNDLIGVSQGLIDFIVSRHGRVEYYKRKRPFIYHKGGKTFTGIIDLTVMTPEGCVLVCHDPALIPFCRTALEGAGTKVTAAYIYNPISGLIEQLSEKSDI